jgi:hypothetical protein
MKALLVAVACGGPMLVHCAQLAQQTTLDQGYREMYNLQFADAHRTFHDWELAHPDDPMAPVSDAAAYLFSEFDRLKILQSELFVDNHAFFGMRRTAADPVARDRFQRALAQTDELTSRALATEPQDANALLARVLRIGLDADYLALIDKKYLASLSKVKAGRALAEKLISEHPDMYDAYLASGVENYLLSQKPAPVRWVLHATGAQTDKQTGIEKLRITAEKGRYLKPYARLLLAVAALRDRDIPAARQRLEWLAHEFPLNRLYREELSKLH